MRIFVLRQHVARHQLAVLAEGRSAMMRSARGELNPGKDARSFLDPLLGPTERFDVSPSFTPSHSFGHGLRVALQGCNR